MSERKLGPVLNEAQEIITAAESRAREILEQAEEIRHSAREAGYAEGHQAGQDEVVSTSIRLLEESAKLSERLSVEAARLAIAICSYVIGRHVEVSPETVRHIALRALQESVIGESARIAVHPADYTVIEAAIPEFRRLAGGASIFVETDETLTRGGCVLRTDFGEVDSSIEALIDAISVRLGIRV